MAKQGRPHGRQAGDIACNGPAKPGTACKAGAGRKGKYEAWLEPDNLTRLEAWARDGLTDEQIAHNMGITSRTLRDWKERFSSVFSALKKGRDVVDIQVENALLRRALGYSYTETTRELEFDPDSGEKVLKTTKVVTKQVAPDTTAQIFWLKNRRPDKWRDKPVDESESATLSAARELLGGIPSCINGKAGK